MQDVVDGIPAVVEGLPEVIQEVADRFEESLPAAVRTHWQTLTTATKAFFNGLKMSESVHVSVLELNYDPATRAAAQPRIGFFHTPWLQCVDCYVYGALNASIQIEVGATPTLFQAEVGGTMRGKAYVEASLPTPAAANNMSNWHNLVPRVPLGSASFTVG